MSDEQRPKRRYVIELFAGGDTYEEALQLLDELCDRAHEGPDCRTVIGGCTSGGTVEVIHDPEMTHDKYVEALERRRAAKVLAAN